MMAFLDIQSWANHHCMVGWGDFWLLGRPLRQDDQRKVVHTAQATAIAPSLAFQNHDSERIWLDECPSLDQSSQNTSPLSITLHSIFQLTLNLILITLHLTFQYTSNDISHFRFTFQLQTSTVISQVAHVITTIAPTYQIHLSEFQDSHTYSPSPYRQSGTSQRPTAPAMP